MITARLLLAACLGLLGADADPAPALRGFDPVALCGGQEVQGRDDLRATHGRFAYRFADEASRERFLADAERWCIQWGGGCGRMGPLSGTGDPQRWSVHAGRIYVFASDGCRAGFLAAPERFVVAPAPSSDEAAGAEARAAGARWIERAVEAHGGAGAIDGQNALRLALDEEQRGWRHRLEELVTRDGRLLRRSTWTSLEPNAKASETSWVLDDDAFIDEKQGTFPVTSADQLADLRRFAQREPIALLWARGDDGFEAVHLGPGELAGEPVENVRVRAGELATTLHLDPGSGRVRGLSWRGRPDDGVTRDVVERFTQWREVEGAVLPTARTVLVDGKESPSLSVAWTTVELLSDVPWQVFVRGAR